MRQVLTEFIQEVRAAGLSISLAESIDAMRAASAVSLERDELREALAAAVVKEEGDRAVFDEVFARFFSAGNDEIRRTRKGAATGAQGEVRRSGNQGEGAAGKPRQPEKQPARIRPSLARPEARESRAVSRRTKEPRHEIQKRLRRRELLRKPFREMDPLEGEELVSLAADLSRRYRARLSRRLRYGKRGRLDFRRTLRRSVTHGGAAFDLVFRRRRPGRPDLVVLCDVSGSVRHASEFFVSLLAPCHDFFRRVRTFVFVDRPVEATFEAGRLVPHGAIDFHAFSDFGRVLADLQETLVPSLGRSTVLVVLGDARNNRRPARADLLKQMRSRVRTLWWLNPERRERWGQGDSAIESYRPACHQVLECANGGELVAALTKIAG